MLKVLNYLVLSICHNVGKISTMYYNVVDKARNRLTPLYQTDPIISNRPHYIKQTPLYQTDPIISNRPHYIERS